jgi:hypothetical protein
MTQPADFPCAALIAADIAETQRLTAGAATAAEMARRLHAAGRLSDAAMRAITEDDRPQPATRALTPEISPPGPPQPRAATRHRIDPEPPPTARKSAPATAPPAR